MKRFRREWAAAVLIALLALVLSRTGVCAELAALLESAYQAEETPRPALRKPDLPVLNRVTASPASTASPVPSDTPRVRNSGGVSADLGALLAEGWSYALTGEGVEILILHSHTSECYRDAGSGKDGRSSDPTENVTAVGAAMAEALTALGWGVYHETGVFDSPQYAGAYDRSALRVRELLEEYPGIRVVIDLHRDALGGAATAVSLDGVSTAQVMLLLTTGADGLYHPNYRENLKLGLELQQSMERLCPGLARELYLSSARYNQHLCPGSLLLEVGTDADTLEEAKAAAVRAAEALDAVLRSGQHTAGP